VPETLFVASQIWSDRINVLEMMVTLLTFYLASGSGVADDAARAGAAHSSSQMSARPAHLPDPLAPRRAEGETGYSRRPSATRSPSRCLPALLAAAGAAQVAPRQRRWHPHDDRALDRCSFSPPREFSSRPQHSVSFLAMAIGTSGPISRPRPDQRAPCAGLVSVTQFFATPWLVLLFFVMLLRPSGWGAGVRSASGVAQTTFGLSLPVSRSPRSCAAR
jgi:hypothetical protein